VLSQVPNFNFWVFGSSSIRHDSQNGQQNKIQDHAANTQQLIAQLAEQLRARPSPYGISYATGDPMDESTAEQYARIQNREHATEIRFDDSMLST